ncbi:hypothetical protein [Hymenobacter koreensis]
MYVSRRHSRKLFFPVGLLCLPLVLLLGCLTIAWDPVWGPAGRVLQISMPLLNIDENLLKAQSEPDESHYSPTQLEKFRLWQTVVFTGNPWQDYYSYRTASYYIDQLSQAPEMDAGLRVYFQPTANYRSLVQMLSWVVAADVKRYWIDIRHSPTAFYAVTSKPKPPQPSNRYTFICGTNDAMLRIYAPEEAHPNGLMDRLLGALTDDQTYFPPLFKLLVLGMVLGILYSGFYQLMGLAFYPKLAQHLQSSPRHS